MQISFLAAANEPTTPFPLNNIPFGTFTRDTHPPHIGVAIGDRILDLFLLPSQFPELFSSPIFPLSTAEQVLTRTTLNEYLALSRSVWQHVRGLLQDLLSQSPTNRHVIDADEDIKQNLLPFQSSVTMHLPAHIGDYTDFYSSISHATNVGTMFRGPENALPAAWLHMPIAYHGRASSVVVSGTPVRRPVAQLRPDASAPPVFAPSKLLDFELEMAVLIGGENALGDRVKVEDAGDRVFGFMLMNDWSARDVQKWEYVPLGPFGAKNLSTTVSPWVVPLEALEPFKVPSMDRRVPILPYLQADETCRANCLYNVELNVAIQAGKEEPSVVTKSNLRNLYWTVAQQIAHHTVTGCNMRPGDLIASGTISGEEESSLGSMLELSWKGTRKIVLSNTPTPTTRTFLQDGDTVIMTGVARGDGYTIGFGSWNKSFAADWLEQNRTARLKPLYGGWEVSARKMGDIEVKIKGNAC